MVTGEAGLGSRDGALPAEEALDGLLPPRLSARRRLLAETVRSALRERDDLAARLHAAHAHAGTTAAAVRRQAQLDAIRALADVLAEVEELAAAGADVRVVAQRARALGEAFGLLPLGRAGETTAFDPRCHQVVGARPPDGSVVTVLRPGYAITFGTPDPHLVHHAQVVWDARD